MGKSFIDNFNVENEEGRELLLKSFKVSKAHSNVMSPTVKDLVKYTIRN